MTRLLMPDPPAAEIALHETYGRMLKDTRHALNITLGAVLVQSAIIIALLWAVTDYCIK